MVNKLTEGVRCTEADVVHQWKVSGGYLPRMAATGEEKEGESYQGKRGIETTDKKNSAFPHLMFREGPAAEKISFLLIEGNLRGGGSRWCIRTEEPKIDEKVSVC